MTASAETRAYVLLLLALTAARLLVAAITPLTADEAYYWVWSTALAPGYVDHPPMVALWIRAGVVLAGDNALGIRLLAPVTAALGSVLVAQAGNDLLPGQRAGPMAALFLNATLLLGIGAVTMTPDTPLLLFWIATLWALGRLLATGRGGWWLVAGAAVGLALDSKYTAALLLPAVLAWLLLTPAMRPWLRRWQPWAAAALALLLFLPVLGWNARHGWASFAKQGGRLSQWEPVRAVQFLGELIGGQIGLATPVIALLGGAGIWLALRRAWQRDPSWTLLAALTVLPAAVFLEHALGDRVQGNWPAVMYPAAAIAAAGLGGRWARLARPGVALGLALTLLVWVQAIAAPLKLPPRLDPTLLRLGGWAELAGSVAAEAHRQGAGYVAAGNYGQAALLARLLPAEVPVLGVESRWALFDLPDGRPVIAGRPGLLLRDARGDDAPDAADWASATLVGEIARSRDGVVAERFRLYRVVGRPAGTPVAVLPRPGEFSTRPEFR